VEQTTVTRINDRPPLDGPQAMRLSRAAAAQLGIDCGGTVEVRLTVLKEPAEE
jgi:rare lipoprotein A (peptidoglycan hydrolase)